MTIYLYHFLLSGKEMQHDLKTPRYISSDKLCREPSSGKHLKARGLIWAPSPQERWRRECSPHMKGVGQNQVLLWGKVPNLQHEHRLPLADVTIPVTALQWMVSVLCMCPSSASTFNLCRMQTHPLAFSNALAYARMVWLTSINLWRGRG